MTFKVTLFLLNITAVICLVSAECRVPEFTKCVEGDFACYQSSTPQVAPLFLNGCPELGIVKFNPLFLQSLNASTPLLKLSLGDVTISGIDTCNSIDFGRNENGKLYNKLLCDLKFEGTADVEGNLLGFHTEAKGTMKIVYNRILLFGMASVSRNIGADNKYHLNFIDYEIDSEMLGQPEISFTNQLRGDGKLLHGSLDGFLKVHPPREVVAEFTKRIINDLVTIFGDNINNFFAYMPIEDLVLPRT